MKITQETFAEMIGPGSIARDFFDEKFRQRGFIEYQWRNEGHNSLLNVVLRY